MNRQFLRNAAFAAVGMTCLAATALPAMAEEEKPTADLTVGAYSSYIWRGYELNDNSLVIQPSMTVGYKGFSANLWGNLDTDVAGADAKNWNETDLTLAYDTAFDKIGVGVGYIYYGLDGADDTQEVYAKVSYDCILSPSLTVYRDYDAYNGWYYSFAISHSLPVTDTINLDLGASIGYLDVDDAATMADSAGNAYSEFHDGVLSASASIPVAKYLTITPTIRYSFGLSSEAKDYLDASNPSGDNNILYGGVSASFAF